MESFRNLVPDSELLQEAVQLLHSSGGRAPAVHVAESVLQLPGLEPPEAVMLLTELIRDDWRLRISDISHELELAHFDDESRHIDETDFIVFDVETTGPKAPPARIVEIGACRVSRGKIVAEFQTLLNPKARIPPFISRLTGITDAMVKDAPAFEEIVEEWLAFAGDAVLVAHDAHFDVRFINHEVSLAYPGRRMANTHLCTVTLARRLFPELGFYRLHALAEHFEVSLANHHRAAADARATAEIFLRLLEHLVNRGFQDLASTRTFAGNAKKKPRRHGNRRTFSSRRSAVRHP